MDVENVGLLTASIDNGIVIAGRAEDGAKRSSQSSTHRRRQVAAMEDHVYAGEEASRLWAQFVEVANQFGRWVSETMPMRMGATIRYCMLASQRQKTSATHDALTSERPLC